MSVDEWHYYNHAAIPSTPPHEDPDIQPVKSGEIWKMSGTPLLARWTTEFDCGYETNWWYCIKDTPFDLSSIKSNYRYKINKEIKNFDVRVIEPKKYIQELYEVFKEAFASWPAKYRPQFTYSDAEALSQKLSVDSEMICYGAFYRETGELCGIMQAPTYETHVEL